MATVDPVTSVEPDPTPPSLTPRPLAAAPPPATAAGGSARCARCGYPVRGLPTFTCPECGSDLRAVGIYTPRTAARWRLAAPPASIRHAAGVVAPALAALLVLATGAAVLYLVLSRLVVSHHETELVSFRVYRLRFMMSAEGIGPASAPVPKDRVSVECVEYDGRSRAMAVSLPDMTVEYKDPFGMSVRGPVETHVDLWLRQWAVLDDGKGTRNAVARDMVAVLRASGKGLPLADAAGGVRTWEEFGHSSVARRTNPAWLPAAAVAAWLPGWFLILRWMYGRLRCGSTS